MLPSIFIDQLATIFYDVYIQIDFLHFLLKRQWSAYLLITAEVRTALAAVLRGHNVSPTYISVHAYGSHYQNSLAQSLYIHD